jgi:citrate lyase subunit beta/citryl-CoA lyase
MTPRSYLFVPADRPDRIAKALATPAHVVVVDLEDAVAPAAKASARAALLHHWEDLGVDAKARIALRINGAGTPWRTDDLRLVSDLARTGLDCAICAKAEDVSEVAEIADMMPDGRIIPLIESAQGLAALDSLARCKGVARLAFGHLDFQLDLGIQCDVDERELDGVRFALVMASRQAGLPAPIDGVTVQVHDEARLQLDCSRSRRFGFAGKLCIHPRQVPFANVSFGPTPQQKEWAQRVLQAASEHENGAFTFEGGMVDVPVLARAKRYLSIS